MIQAEQTRFFNFSLRTFLTQAAVTLLGATIMIVTTRALGPEGKGMLTLLVLIPILTLALFHLGIGQATIYYAPRVPRASLVGTSTVMIAGIGFLAILLALPVVLGLRRMLFRGIPAGWLIFMCALIPIVLFYDLFTALFQALYRIDRRNILILAFPTFNLIFFLLMVFNWKMGVKGGMIAWALAFILTVILGAGLLVSIVAPTRLRIDSELGRGLLRFGVRSYWGSLLNMLNSRFDFFLVGIFLSPAEVGFFSVSVYVAELLWKLPESVCIVLQPRVAQLPEEEARNFTPRVLRLLMPPLLLVALLIAVFNGPIVRILFGASFGASGPALLILLPGFLANAFCKVLSTDMLARGHPLKYSGSAAMAFFAMFLFDLWLIPRFGIRGAALAATIAYFLSAWVMIIFYLRATRIPLSSLFLPGPNDQGILKDAGKVIRFLMQGARQEPAKKAPGQIC
jgi:O-antigen/teichoic acid export membrane protein